MAILVKVGCPFSTIHLHNENALAIDLTTNHDPLAVLTAYVPRGQYDIPSRAMRKVLNRNIPTILIGAFNAHHAAFFNTPTGRDDIRVRFLFNLMMARNLTFLGSFFHPFIGARPGTPNLVQSIHVRNKCHTRISPGGDVGSDHIPTIIQLQTALLGSLAILDSTSAPSDSASKWNSCGRIQ